MTGATATRLECPRCGGSVPSWQPLHVRCFVYRVRAVVWVLAAAVVLPVAVYGFRFVSVVYERSRVNVAAAGTPADQQSFTTVSPPDTTRSAETVEPRDPVQRKPSPTVMATRPPEAGPPPPTLKSTVEGAREPRVQVGDRWVLRSDDLNNPKWSNVTERKVLQATESQLVVSSRNTQSNYTRTLVFTPTWNLIKSREPDGKGYDYSPPLKYFDFPLFPGKKWAAEVQEARAGGQPTRKHQMAAVVEGWEDVTVPAGTFRALKIVLRIKALEESVVTRDSEDVSWYVPKVKRSVKTVETSVNHSSGLRTMRTVTLIDVAVSN